SYFVLEIVAAFSQTFTHLVTRKPTHGDLLASLRDFFGDQFADSLRRLFDERLIEQNEFFVELIQAAFDDLVDHLIWLVGVLRIVFRLRACDLALFVEHVSGDFIARHVPRLRRRDMHRHVLYELLKFVATRDEISFTIHFNQHADLTTHVDVRTDDAFGGDPTLFLLR